MVSKAFNTVDFAPTILSFMEQNVPTTMVGRNFSKILTNPNLEKNWNDITFVRNGGSAKKPKWVAAITSRYKLVLSMTDTPWLIDMQKDPNEVINFISKPEYESIIKELALQLKDYGITQTDPFLKDTKMADDLISFISK